VTPPEKAALSAVPVPGPAAARKPQTMIPTTMRIEGTLKNIMGFPIPMMRSVTAATNPMMLAIPMIFLLSGWKKTDYRPS